jgi:hypothetical protein
VKMRAHLQAQVGTNSPTLCGEPSSCASRRPVLMLADESNGEVTGGQCWECWAGEGSWEGAATLHQNANEEPVRLSETSGPAGSLEFKSSQGNLGRRMQLHVGVLRRKSRGL